MILIVGQEEKLLLFYSYFLSYLIIFKVNIGYLYLFDLRYCYIIIKESRYQVEREEEKKHICEKCINVNVFASFNKIIGSYI